MAPARVRCTRESNDAVPVLYLNDGQNLFDPSTNVFRRAEWQADEIATQLIAERKIPPIIIVGIDHAGNAEARAREYLAVRRLDTPPAGGCADGSYLSRIPRAGSPSVCGTALSHHTGRERPRIRSLVLWGHHSAVYGAVRPALVGGLLPERPTLYVADQQLLRNVEQQRTWPEKRYLAIGGKESTRDSANEEAVVW